MYQLLLILFFLKETTSVNTFIKKWNINNDFFNSENWDKRRVPCKTDTVVFPKYMEGDFLFPSSEFKQVVFPASGELLLPFSGKIWLSDNEHDESCPGEEIKYNRPMPGLWLDYMNWDFDGMSPATPHLLRLPCNYDVAFFPHFPSLVRLPPLTIQVGMIKISSLLIKWTNYWVSFLDGDIGRKQFLSVDPIQRTKSVMLTGSTGCNKSSGCECGTFKYEQYSCPLHNCPPPPCDSPVKPLAHCCPICGAYMVFNFSREFVLKDAEKRVNDFLDGEKLYWDVSVVVNGQLQVVLVDKEGYTESQSIAQKLHHYLIKEVELPGVKATNLKSSGMVHGTAGLSTKLALFVGSFVIASLCFVFLIQYYQQETFSWDQVRQAVEQALRSRGGRFMFARFENTTGEVELMSERGEEPSETLRAFHNPMYAGQQDLEPLDLIAQVPVYSEMKAKEMAEDTLLVDSDDSAEECDEGNLKPANDKDFEDLSQMLNP